jgi:hypothetical protein
MSEDLNGISIDENTVFVQVVTGMATSLLTIPLDPKEIENDYIQKIESDDKSKGRLTQSIIVANQPNFNKNRSLDESCNISITISAKAKEGKPRNIKNYTVSVLQQSQCRLF